ncbi:MAG: hypothetical protein MUP13_00430, partial [Thermoanaerobaculales bacterium]|nr:hypothetical protein [Thermoanaerobaculales bacterium]
SAWFGRVDYTNQQINLINPVNAIIRRYNGKCNGCWCGIYGFRNRPGLCPVRVPGFFDGFGSGRIGKGPWEDKVVGRKICFKRVFKR